MPRAEIVLLASVVGFSLWLGEPACAQSGRSVVEELVHLLAGKDGGAPARVSKGAAACIDYDVMAERALGASVWSRLTSLQRREFVTALRRSVGERYYPRWHRLFSKGRIAYLNETAADGDVLVGTVLVVGRKESRVVWRLAGRAGEMKVVSLAVGDRDLSKRLNEHFQRHLKKDGFEGTLSWLRDRAAGGENQGQAGSMALFPERDYAPR